MSSFIREVVEKVYDAHGERMDKVNVIFPNRRAGLFFRKELGSLVTSPVWMPRISSLEDFVVSRSALEKVDVVEAIFMLYECYKQYPIKEEPFDKFFFWGEMILRDFEEIDHYLVEPDKLFTSIKNQKELDEAFFFLDEEHQKVIQQFWSTFLPHMTNNQKAFTDTWRILGPVYHNFREKLKSKGKGYNGLIYREYIKQLGDLTPDVHDQQYVFAGFNALTFTEEKILKYFVTEHGAQIFWDSDSYYLDNKTQEAGNFQRTYKSDHVLGQTFAKEASKRFEKPKSMTATGVSLEVGQAKAMGEMLDELAMREDFQPEETVIVLPQEYMLFPVLHSLPDSIDQVNITMGYPLKDTPVYSLLESLLRLQATRREDVVMGASFYHKPTIEVLEHPLINAMGKIKVEDFLNEIKKRNLIYVYQEELPLDIPILNVIFDQPEKPLEYLISVLASLHENQKQLDHAINLEFISRFHELISILQDIIGPDHSKLGYDFLIRLFRRFAASLKIPFTGEPLNGIQIMGILETRNLDFKNVFILNMNEDSWPAPPRRGSFIPYNIRRAFDLPVHEHQDAIYSYLFYRLLQRADNVQFYYNIVSEFNINGELCRWSQPGRPFTFLYQKTV